MQNAELKTNAADCSRLQSIAVGIQVLLHRAFRFPPPAFRLLSVLLTSYLLLLTFAFADNPVHFRIKSAGAREAPPTIEDMLFMVEKPTRVDLATDLPSLCSVSNGEYGISWRAGGWQRPFHIAEYSGLIQIPSGNEYTFLVRKPYFGPVYFLINGEPIVDYPNRHVVIGRQYRRRRPAAPSMDSNLSSDNSANSGITLADNVTVPPGWIAGKTIHLEKGPVEFRAILFCEHRVDFSLKWLTSGQTEPSDIPSYLFKHTDKLRHTGVEGRPLVYRAADARPAGIPDFSYEEDAIRPEVHLRSNEKALDVIASMSKEGRIFAAVTSSVDIVKSWGRVVLPETQASECDLIEWSVIAKDGEALANGAARLLKMPYDVLPDRVDGASFMIGNTNCFFVAKRWGNPSQPEPPAVSDKTKMIFINGFGDSVSNYLDRALALTFAGNVPKIEKEVRVGDLSSDTEAMLAARENIEILNAVRLAKSDFVLLAPEIRGPRAAESPSVFERRLAATVGMLSRTCGRNIILVTPPQEDDIDMRPYSSIIHRIADANGLCTADLYTMSRVQPMSTR